MKIFNRDEKRRDEFIFGKHEPEKYIGGVRPFSRLNVDTLKRLIAEGFVDPKFHQNRSPCIQEFLEFAQKWNSQDGYYCFDGYVVSESRDDYRVSINAIRRNNGNFTGLDERFAFEDLIRESDAWEINKRRVYAWWD